MLKIRISYLSSVSFGDFCEFCALAYANPVISGKQLLQHDIVQYKGGAKELAGLQSQQLSQETYWSDAMFGGMPTYQTGATVSR